MADEELASINIRPGVNILAVLRHLHYRPWFALAEFVDNAIQSFVNNKTELEALHGKSAKVVVRIDIDFAKPGRISIKDNACGIAQGDFQRAFRPAALPNDASGLSEFGMGMKSAACWFAPFWHVRTKALGEEFERLIKFDVNQIVDDQIEELQISKAPSKPDLHFTEVVLDELHHLPAGRTIGKIRDHLTDIYREFIRKGILELHFNNEQLTYTEPNVLNAPYVRDKEGPSRLWRKEIDFPLGNGMSVKGFAALRDPGNSSRSGFALFRRGRLIQGSGDDGYRPLSIYKQPGSFRSLRLFGELHLEGFEVSHTKDGFRWDENEEPFLELLEEYLDGSDLPLLKQADDYRSRASKAERQKAAEKALDKVGDAMEKGLPDALPEIADQPQAETPTTPLPTQITLARREIEIDFRGKKWIIRVELTDDPAESQWLTISDQGGDSKDDIIEIRVAMAHPFMVSFAQTDPDDVEALLRIAAALALAEKLARLLGQKYAGTIRRNMNDILRDVLSQP